MVAVFVALTFVSLMIVNLSVDQWRTAHAGATNAVPQDETRSAVVPAFGADTLLQVPEGVHLSKEHTWFRPYGSGGLELGADALLAYVVGTAGRVVLPKVGTQLEVGQPLFRVEHNGCGMTIPSAVSGRILAVNSELKEHPELLGQDPYGAGWVCYVGPARMEGKAPSPGFAEQPVAWLENEFVRLREFIFAQVSPDVVVGVTSQDGGVPTAGCLSQLDQKSWTTFEADFLRRG